MAVSGLTAGTIAYVDASGWTASTDPSYDAESLSIATFNLNSTVGQVKVNGTEVVAGVGEWTESTLGGTTTLGSSYLNADFLDGNLYSAILRNTTSTTDEIDKAEKYINTKMGGGLL